VASGAIEAGGRVHVGVELWVVEPVEVFENEGVEICRDQPTRIVRSAKQKPVVQSRLKTKSLDGGLALGMAQQLL